MTFTALLRKYPVEAAIVVAFIVLLLGAVVFPTLHSAQAPAPPAAAPAAAVAPVAPVAPAALHTAPPLSGMKPFPGRIPMVIDSVSQGAKAFVFKPTVTPVSLSLTKPIAVYGWATDYAKPAAGVYLVIDGTKRIPARYGIDRPDVARALSAPAARYVGFLAEIPANALKPGTHTFTLLVIANNRRGYYPAQGHTTGDFTPGP